MNDSSRPADRRMSGNNSLAHMFRTHGTVHRFAAGETVYQKGDYAHEIYYLMKGRVRTCMMYPDGSEHTLYYVDQGNIVGEEVVAVPPERIVTVRAVTDLVMYGMTKQSLLRCSVSCQCLDEVMELFMKKIDSLSSWIYYASFTRTDARLAGFLYDRSETDTSIACTQEQIAELIGTTRISVSTIFRRFEEEGLIRKAYRRIEVLNREGLLSYLLEPGKQRTT